MVDLLDLPYVAFGALSDRDLGICLWGASGKGIALSTKCWCNAVAMHQAPGNKGAKAMAFEQYARNVGMQNSH